MGCCQFARSEMGEIRISTPINSVTNTNPNYNEENDDFHDISINSHDDSFDKDIITDDPSTADQPTLATLRFEILNQLRPRSISNPTLLHGLHSASLLSSKIMSHSGSPHAQMTPKVAQRQPTSPLEKGKHKRSATFSFAVQEIKADMLESIKSNYSTLSFKHENIKVINYIIQE